MLMLAAASASAFLIPPQTMFEVFDVPEAKKELSTWTEQVKDRLTHVGNVWGRKLSKGAHDVNVHVEEALAHGYEYADSLRHFMEREEVEDFVDLEDGDSEESMSSSSEEFDDYEEESDDEEEVEERRSIWRQLKDRKRRPSWRKGPHNKRPHPSQEGQDEEDVPPHRDCKSKMQRHGGKKHSKSPHPRFEEDDDEMSSHHEEDDLDGMDGPPEHPPPHHRRPGPPHHRRPPHKGPRHGGKRRGHHGFPNDTLYEVISKSKFHTKLFELIKEDSELVDLLNSTKANHTIFAPTNKAIEKIQNSPHYKKPSKEIIHKVLLYHIVSDLYPAGRLLSRLTIPTLLEEEKLGGEGQRLRISLGLRGLEINLFGHVVAANIFTKTGIIHAVDNLLLPPPELVKILELLPGTFSTLVNGLYKTELIKAVTNVTEGVTFFAPSNAAFQKLGARANAFLFSKYGEKYLKALLKYHVAPGKVVYTDGIVDTTEEEAADVKPPGGLPKGHYHADLDTLLEDHKLSVDIGRFGRLVDFVVNRYSRVGFKDAIARDGVLQIMNSCILPPKKLESEEDGAVAIDYEISVDELKERLSTVL